MLSEALARAESLIRTIPDYPDPGVQFRDITPLLADASAVRTVIHAMIAPFEGSFDVVAGVEARGFLLAGAVAMEAGVGLVPIRKAGKLPLPAASVTYALEYGTATIEAHDDIAGGTRVLLVDDVLATGGTLAAARQLVEGSPATLLGASVLLEIPVLGGRARSPIQTDGGDFHGQVADQVGHGIDEMAALADDASATHCPVADPRVRGQSPGKNAVDDRMGTVGRGTRVLHGAKKW